MLLGSRMEYPYRFLIRSVKLPIIMDIIMTPWSTTFFGFAPTGKIIFSCINFPGSWHDSQVILSLISKVVENIGDFKICLDQGFPRSGDLLNKFAEPISRRSRQNLPDETRREVLRRHNIFVSLRQSLEWGMRSPQGTFTRIKSRLTFIKRK